LSVAVDFQHALAARNPLGGSGQSGRVQLNSVVPVASSAKPLVERNAPRGEEAVLYEIAKRHDRTEIVVGHRDPRVVD